MKKGIGIDTQTPNQNPNYLKNQVVFIPDFSGIFVIWSAYRREF
jgi:hypothetical protein